MDALFSVLGAIAGLAIVGAFVWAVIELPMHKFCIAMGILLMVVVLSGCASTIPYAELGAGYNNNLFGGENWDNANSGPFGATIEAGMEWEVPKNPTWSAKCRWLHLSHWSAGPPFDDRLESSVDHLGCAIRKEWRP